MGNYTSMSTQGETIESSIEKFNSKLEELDKRIKNLEKVSVPVVVPGQKEKKEYW